jgi:hypothetical protein
MPDIQKVVIPELPPITNKDTQLGIAIKRITDQLNQIASEINAIRARLSAGGL